MFFNPKKTSFGRHETFALRYGWLTKGYQAVDINDKVFTDDDATMILGVGKNMVASIRYWLIACQVLIQDTLESTDTGYIIFDDTNGLDKYLEDEATIWLLHWLLATNPNNATSWYWFFNKFHKAEFTSLELTTALTDFVNDTIIEGKKPSANTLKNDAQLLHRMYTQSKVTARAPLEDSLDSPFSLLRLVSQSSDGRRYISRPEARESLPLVVFGYAVLQVMQARNIKSIPIEELMYSRDKYFAPGAVFRMTENGLMTKVEQLILAMPGFFEIRDTAGIHQLFLLKECCIKNFLRENYNGFTVKASV